MMKVKVLSIFLILTLFTGGIGFATDDALLINKDYIENNIYENNVVESLNYNYQKAKFGELSVILSINKTRTGIDQMKDYGMYPGPSQRLSLGFMYDTLLDKTVNGINQLGDTVKTTSVSMISASRDLLMMYENALLLYDVETGRYEIAQNSYNSSISKMELGLISETEMMAAEVDLMEAELDFVKAGNSLESAKYSLLNMLGLDLDTEIEVEAEEARPFLSVDIDNAVEYAYLHRSELKVLEDTIDINERDRQVYIDNMDYVEEQENHMRDLERIEYDIQLDQVRLQDTKDEISIELRQAYADLNKNYNNMMSFKTTLDQQYTRLNQMQLQYEAGYITADMLKEFELTVNELEATYNMLIRTYNNSFYKFENAFNLGPAYTASGGGF